MGEGALTDGDREFLGRPLYGFLTVAAGAVPPQPRPVWFEVGDDGTVRMFSDPGAVKVRRLRADPRASLVVAAPVGERERWVAVSGRVELVEGGAGELVGRLFDRYWGEQAADRAEERAAMVGAEWVRIVLRPDAVKRFTNQ